MKVPIALAVAYPAWIPTANAANLPSKANPAPSDVSAPYVDAAYCSPFWFVSCRRPSKRMLEPKISGAIVLSSKPSRRPSGPKVIVRNARLCAAPAVR